MSEIFLELINGFFSLLNVEAFLIMTTGVF